MPHPGKKAAGQQVWKPGLTGSWHGPDLPRLAGKAVFCTLGITVLQFLCCLWVLSVESLPVCVLLSTLVILAGFAYMYGQGRGEGRKAAAFSEILYTRRQEGKSVSGEEEARCYHPAKGFVAALLGGIPYVLVALAAALFTHPAAATQAQAASRLGLTALDVLSMGARALVMPFVCVVTRLEGDAMLWLERLSPLLVLLSPLGFGLGYQSGLRARMRINTSIAVRVEVKRRKQRKEKSQRARSDSPQRLI